MPSVSFKFDDRQIRKAMRGMSRKVVMRSARKAVSTASRDMKSTAQKRIREKKRIKVRRARQALKVMRNKPMRKLSQVGFALKADNVPLFISEFPHRQIRKGVSVAVNTGPRTVLRGAFIAPTKRGRMHVWRRTTKKRHPLQVLFGSRPADVLFDDDVQSDVLERGAKSMRETFLRLLPIEMEKG